MTMMCQPHAIVITPGKYFPNEWMDLLGDFQWMLCKTNFTEYILQGIAYKTIEFLFTYFFFFFLFITKIFFFIDNIIYAEK